MACVCNQKRREGQMTVELAIAFPALLAIALVASNAFIFLGHCAAFDRLSRQTIRVYAASPEAHTGTQDQCAQIEGALAGSEGFRDCDIEVSAQPSADGLVTFTASLAYHPSFFGRPLLGSVFGVSLPVPHHSVEYAVDGYKPGVLL